MLVIDARGPCICVKRASLSVRATEVVEHPMCPVSAVIHQNLTANVRSRDNRGQIRAMRSNYPLHTSSFVLRRSAQRQRHRGSRQTV